MRLKLVSVCAAATALTFASLAVADVTPINVGPYGTYDQYKPG